MENIQCFYKVLDNFILSGAWKNLSNQRVLAVEIPESKEMYYVTVDIRNLEASDFNVDVVKGSLGLSSLREAFDPKANPIDKIRRSDFMNISFEHSKASLLDEYSNVLDESYNYKGFEAVGYPFMFYKIEGHTSRPLDETLISDLSLVFEALMSQDFGRIKKTKINKKTKIKTFYKEENIWQLNEVIHQLSYPKVQYSGLEVYPLLKQSDKITEIWYMVSIYDYMISDTVAGQENLKVPAFQGTVYLLDSKDDILNHKNFLGAAEEMPAMKKVVAETLKDFEIRPRKVITNLRSLFYGFKDFMEALEIIMVYEPSNINISDFSEYMLYENDFEEEMPIDDLFSEGALVHFLERKGISLEDFYQLSEKEAKKLIDEFGEIIKELMNAFETLIEETAGNLEDLSAEEMSQVIEDFFIKGIDEKVDS
jgi:hypothetical protein